MPSGFSVSEPKTRRRLSFVSPARKPGGLSQLFDLSYSEADAQNCLVTWMSSREGLFFELNSEGRSSNGTFVKSSFAF